jgi:hypothetical protein
MGEVSLPRARFWEWFIFYQERWKSSNYKLANYWVLTPIKGEMELNNLERKGTRMKRYEFLRRRMWQDAKVNHPKVELEAGFKAFVESQIADADAKYATHVKELDALKTT